MGKRHLMQDLPSKGLSRGLVDQPVGAVLQALRELAVLPLEGLLEVKSSSEPSDAMKRQEKHIRATGPWTPQTREGLREEIEKGFAKVHTYV